MDQKKSWSFAGLFMVVLVLTLPFYSANALAVSLQITKNEGQAGINKHLDAQGDIWTVETLITGVLEDPINLEKVRLQIGNNDAPFTSCTKTNLGVVCEYIDPLTDGIKENEYSFRVIYNFLNQNNEQDSSSNADVIKADGSAPAINILLVEQIKDKGDNQGKVKIDFTVTDKKTDLPSVGLRLVEIIDAETGQVLQSIPISEKGKESYRYLNDGNFLGFLQAPLTGEGKKRIKVRAEDNLGHQATSKYTHFFGDFVKPIISSELELTRFGKFIGEFTGKTDIKVDITESSVPTVVAHSNQAELSGEQAECNPDDEIDNLWHCQWSNVDVKPESEVKVLVIATDQYGNREEKTLTKTLTVDTLPPKLNFFGTDRIFEEKSYLKSGENRIILRAEDQGAGISSEGIRTNLGVFGLSNFEEAQECVEENGVLECFWEVDDKLGEGSLIFGLTKFEDNVGNDGVAPEHTFWVDNTGPKVEEIDIFGSSAAGDKDYYQSNDIIKIVLKVSEGSGLNILVNVNDLVNDAEIKFPESEFIDEDGWQRFTEDNCKRVEGFWECIIETDSIKSGPDTSANLEIKVQDTAGNDASKWLDEPSNVKSGAEGKYRIEIAGLSVEDNPDYWEVRRVVPVGGVSGFIDLDTTSLTYTRLPLQVTLNSDNQNAEVLNVELANCDSSDNETTDKPLISRSLLYGGSTPEGDVSPTPTVILEFEPFNGQEMFHVAESGKDRFEAEYICQLKIFSKVGKSALKAPELQEVKIIVPFAFSKLGAEDENLQQRIDEAREEAEITILEVVAVLAKVLKVLDYLGQVYNIVVSVINIINIPKAAIDVGVAIPGGKLARIAGCFGFNSIQGRVDDSIEIIDQILQVLSCRPVTSKKTGISNNWYASWQNYLIEFYNIQANSILGTNKEAIRYSPPQSIQDNLYLSFASLCLPGIIKNVDKFRQIKCRKIACLENDVPAGLATVSMCNELESLLTCKYFLGELWYIFPLSGFIDHAVNALYQAFKDPFAALHTVTFATCGLACSISGTMSGTCVAIDYVWNIFGILENIIGFVTTVIAEFEQGGLNYCDSVL